MKTFTISGATVSPAVARFDAAVRAFMEQNDLRAGTFAVAKNGRLVLAHGYTFGEPNYPPTYPTSVFRTASATKPVTGIGIYQLIESGALKLDDKVASILNVKLPNGDAPKDDDSHFFNAVTIENLLRHENGWDGVEVGDATFLTDTEVAKAFDHDVPVSIDELISWGVSRPMQFKPGTKRVYSNFGYLLLGRVLAAKRNQSYGDALRKHVFAPLGIRRAFISRTRLEERHLGEVKYHHHPPDDKSAQGPSAIFPGQVSPLQYGFENNANFEGHAGWVISAADYVRMLVGIDQLLPNTPLEDQLFWQPNRPPMPEGVKLFGHGAVIGGGFGVCGRRTDGIALAGFWNTTRADGKYTFDAPDPAVPGAKKTYADHEACWHEIATKIDQDDAWPEYDLFGHLFPPMTRIDGRLNGAGTEIVIETIRPDGSFNGTILAGSQKSAIEGFWNGRTKRIGFVRNVEPGKPSSLQVYHGYLMDSDKMYPGVFTGTFEAFAGTGGTAKRHVFAWVALPEVKVDTSTIKD